MSRLYNKFKGSTRYNLRHHHDKTITQRIMQVVVYPVTLVLNFIKRLAKTIIHIIDFVLSGQSKPRSWPSRGANVQPFRHQYKKKWHQGPVVLEDAQKPQGNAKIVTPQKTNANQRKQNKNNKQGQGNQGPMKGKSEQTPELNQKLSITKTKTEDKGSMISVSHVTNTQGKYSSMSEVSLPAGVKLQQIQKGSLSGNVLVWKLVSMEYKVTVDHVARMLPDEKWITDTYGISMNCSLQQSEEDYAKILGMSISQAVVIATNSDGCPVLVEPYHHATLGTIKYGKRIKICCAVVVPNDPTITWSGGIIGANDGIYIIKLGRVESNGLLTLLAFHMVPPKVKVSIEDSEKWHPMMRKQYLQLGPIPYGARIYGKVKIVNFSSYPSKFIHESHKWNYMVGKATAAELLPMCYRLIDESSLTSFKNMVFCVDSDDKLWKHKTLKYMMHINITECYVFILDSQAPMRLKGATNVCSRHIPKQVRKSLGLTLADKMPVLTGYDSAHVNVIKFRAAYTGGISGTIENLRRKGYSVTVAYANENMEMVLRGWHKDGLECTEEELREMVTSGLIDFDCWASCDVLHKQKYGKLADSS